METKFKGISLTSKFSVTEYRLKLEKMTDAELRKEGKNLADLCDPRKSPRTQPNEQWIVQLNECRDVWRKRHPHPTNSYRSMSPKLTSPRSRS
jgi:hypothetical protein